MITLAYYQEFPCTVAKREEPRQNLGLFLSWRDKVEALKKKERYRKLHERVRETERESTRDLHRISFEHLSK